MRSLFVQKVRDTCASNCGVKCEGSTPEEKGFSSLKGDSECLKSEAELNGECRIMDAKDEFHHAIQSAKKTGKNVICKEEKTTRYLRIDEVPQYLRDNEFIISGYRWGSSYKDNWKSLIRFHNETGNIWSHILGAIAFVYLALRLRYLDLVKILDKGDINMLFIYLICAATCLVMSALFHLHYCHSERAYMRLICLDYNGISILICSSAACVVYFIFKTSKVAQITWFTILVLINLVGVLGPLIFPNWNSPSFRPQRSSVYVLSGALSLTPMIYYSTKYEYFLPLPQFLESFAIPGAILTVLLYVAGVIIYVTRFPERFAPGTFDYLLHSHQLWHLLVVAAAYIQYRAFLGLLLWHKSLVTK